MLGRPAPMVMPPPLASMSTPPEWAQGLVKAAAAPLTDAGAYLGSLMGGQTPFHLGEAMQEAVKLGSSLVGPKIGAGTIAAMAAPVAKAGARLAPEAEQAVAQGIRAYHGSPHDFDAFDLSKIGTGEGVQAYGHGLYFAENPTVAESYKGTAPNGLAWWNPKNAWTPAELPTGKGKMYEVNVNAHPDHFLDWEKPLSDQSDHVKAALQDFNIPEEIDYPRLSSRIGEAPIDEKRALSGADAYRRVGLHAGPKDLNTTIEREIAATEALKNAGIPGIKYLDQGSRAAGTGTRNYVVFDQNLIDIIKKYGIGSLAFLGGANAVKNSQPVPLAGMNIQ